jgi:ATP-binding cassette subfamily F protein uup
VLLLDEPTYDLDVDTLANLEDLLDGWPGTLVVVSHDRYLVERTCDSVVALLGDGRITHLPGGIDEYLRRRTAATAAPASPRPARTAPSDAAQQRAARKEAARLERRMDALAQREEELHAAAADAAETGDVARLAELEAALRTVGTDREAVELEWLAAAELAEG